MKIVRTRTELRKEIESAKQEAKSIGFVPTMGYLHQGHLSLMDKARKENEFLIISIFVNPTQFGPNEDLASYPRNFEQDAKLAESVGVDIIFAPDEKTMYPDGFQTYVQVTDLSQTLCGAKRPGHFLGVCTVVLKLFNLVQPERAYFGQKDAQQVIVIKQMVRDLDLPIEIITCPIVREKDGLAMSSRNKYLNDVER
ncbi:MAG: pantoate--beta-alanine ligase, partial [Desulfobacterales bacterium]|nr:pantoate--beta-alanine ligase [Desulfobacterales bacterium]